MKRKVYRFLAVLSILSIVLVGAAAPAKASTWNEKVDPWVLQTASQGETEFLVYLANQADLSAARDLPTKVEKGWYVYQTLTAQAERTQAPLIAQLEQLGVEYRPYWIANMIWVRGSLADVQQIASRADVAHLYANPSIVLDEPAKAASSNDSPQAIEWNIQKVQADDVWNLGYTGQGAVVSGQDTGYDWDHPALINQYRGWDGANADHDYNWHDAIHENNEHTAPGNPCGFDSPVPCDDDSHGTHTMGTMVGDDGGANQIGMAPGARWIGCRNMEEGWGKPSTYTECYQWFIAPTRVDGSEPRPDLAPDVINNSWGCPTEEGCNPDSLLIPVQNLVAAGIVSAHAAGNAGSSCSSVNDPGAIYDESFSVGATSSSDTIASFSSRGPVTVDGSNRPKPDISAPGVSIRSSVPGGGYASGWSGTSMASPHVAGLVALLISAQPALRGQVAEIEETIEHTAVGHTTTEGCGGDTPTEIPNNTYGWGRIDALAAVESLHQIELEKTASSASVAPGDLITYTLTITHEHEVSPTMNVVLTDTIPLGTSFVSATSPYTQAGDTIQWGFPSLDAMQTESVELTVRTDITATGSIINDDYAVHSDQVAPVRGEPVPVSIVEPAVLELDKQASATFVYPGDLITYTIDLANVHPSLSATNVVLTDTLPLGTTFISATSPYTIVGNTIQWDFAALDPGNSLSVELVVRVDATTIGSVTNADYAVSSDQVAWLQGSPVTTMVGQQIYLPILAHNP